MAKISPCFKRTFVFFNSLFAIFGVVIFGLALFLQQYAEEANHLYAVILLYVIGSVIFIFAVLGAYGAYKESKCALIVFFVLMCLAGVGTLRVAIPVAVSRNQIIPQVKEYFRSEIPLTSDKEHMYNPIQQHFHCCGLLNGYKDWKNEAPQSCNCVGSSGDPSDACEEIKAKNTYERYVYSRSETRRVWSKPCGSVIIEYVEEALIITMAMFFTLAALAILGGMMSLMMIIRVSSPGNPQMLPSLPLSYQPPKYSEVVNY